MLKSLVCLFVGAGAIGLVFCALALVVNSIALLARFGSIFWGVIIFLTVGVVLWMSLEIGRSIISRVWTSS